MKNHTAGIATPLYVLMISSVALAGTDTPLSRFKTVADRLVQAINAQDHAAIGRDFGPIMLKAFPLEKSKPFFANLIGHYGPVEGLGEGRYVPPNQAISPARFQRGRLGMKLVLDSQDKIIGLWFLPPRPAIPVPEGHTTQLRLPVKGEWLVFWGGDTKELNQHHGVPHQQFAFDLLVADAGSATHKADGKSNEDYFAFGREIVSPAYGVVTEVIEGVRDNAPGSMNPCCALGNVVFIKHREHEVSVLAHLKQGSVKVAVGDRVTVGQPIGLCGNSGNSSEPHLHYHLQNTPIIQDGTGIRCNFANVVVARDGKKKPWPKYSPIKGDIVSDAK
ncbi:MAG: M23 family metallopeptidase [Pirellulaceae bacterium]|nr:M23 family metallopeptidase [Pirellulaceae bacterium]